MVKKNLCKLCLKEPAISGSHIIPEFNYTPLYDTKHKLIKVSTNEKRKPEFLQKGVRESLLCDSCENKIGRWEDYAKRTLYGGHNPTIVNQTYQNLLSNDGKTKCTLVKGVDYKTFKLYLLSLLWRYSISKLPEFGLIHLGPHEQIIRDMIYRENPGDKQEYGCLVTALLDSSGNPIEGMIISPDSRKIDGINCCRFIIRGFGLTFFISKHNIPESIRNCFLDQSNELKILHVEDFEHSEYLSRLAKEISKRKDYPELLKRI